jgi:hypothetical protein
MCGKEGVNDREPFCGDCSRSLSREDPPFFDTLIVTSVLVAILSFMVIMERTGSEGFAPLGLKSFEGPVRLLLIIAILSVSIIVIMKRDQFLSFRNMKGAALLVFPLMMSWSLISLLVPGGGLNEIQFSIAILVLSLLFGTVSMGEMLKVGWPLIVVSFLGGIAFELGFAGSVWDLDLRTGIWLIEGPFLMLIGTALVLFSSYRTYRSLDLASKEGVPVLLFSISLVIVLAVLSYNLTIDVSSRPLVGSIGNIFMVLCIALVTLAGKRMLDNVMERTEKEMARSLAKGEGLIEKGELFFGLQQLDLSIRRNPLDGFGRQKGTNNPLFMIEGIAHTDQFTFFPSPTEMALNEKGLTYSSQGRFSDATRQFLEATKRNPNYLEPYWNLSTLLLTTPGKGKEGVRYLDVLVTFRSLYMRRWMKRRIQKDHAEWMYRCSKSYRDTLGRRANLLDRLSKKGDIWAYYRLVG